MARLKGFKRVLSAFACTVLGFELAVSQFTTTTVKADAVNDRVRANIAWGQKKSLEAMASENLMEGLTEDDLRMVGVFLSNFYVPFSTVLGEGGTAEIEESTKKSMVDALVDNCGFDTEVAEAIVPIVWNMSLSTAKPLSIGVLNDDGSVDELTGVKACYASDSSGIVTATNGAKVGRDLNASQDDANLDLQLNEDGTSLRASYYNFLVTWSGGVLPTEKNHSFVSGDSKVYNYCLYWEDGGQKHPVFDATNKVLSGVTKDASLFNTAPESTYKDFSVSNYSLSQIAYMMLCDKLDYAHGYGSSIFSTKNFEEFEALDDEDKATCTVSSSLLYVDTFGNILLDFGGSTDVIVPACVNPYSWYNFDAGDGTAGKSINLINQFFISMVQESNADKPVASIVKTVVSSGKDKELTDANNWESFTKDLADGKAKDYAGRYTNSYKFAIRYADKALQNLDCFRKWYGDDDYEVDKEWFDKEGSETSVVKEYLNKFAFVYDADSVSNNNHLNFPAFDNYMGRSRTIKQTNGLMFSVDESEEDTVVFDDMIMIDNYNLYQQADTSTAFDTLKSVSLFKEPKRTSYGAIKYSSLLSDYNSVVEFSKIGERNRSKVLTLSGAQQKSYMVSIYLSYVYAFYDTSSGDARKIPWAYNKNAFPSAGGLIDWSDIEVESDQMTEELMSMIYYVVHPTKGINFIKTWFKNKAAAIVVSVHEGIVGKSNGVSTTGSTKYIGFSGYVTVPTLKDLAWTNYLLNCYDSMVVYFIIAILIILVFYVMMGSLSLQQAVAGLIIFSVCAYLPPKVINGTVNLSNSICNSIYSSKFTYWALVQHYQYQSDLTAALSSSTEQQYLAKIFESQTIDASTNYAVVTVKWQCPKKENYMVNVKREIEEVSGNSNIFKMISGLVSNQISGETYLETADNLFLYRSYTDLAQYSKTLYEKRDLILDDSHDTAPSGGKKYSFNKNEGMQFTDLKFENNLWYLFGNLNSGNSVSIGSSSFGEFGYSDACLSGLLYYPKSFLDGTYDRLINNSTGNTLKLGEIGDLAYTSHIVMPLFSKDVRTAIDKGVTQLETTYALDECGASEWLEKYTCGIPQNRFNMTIGRANGQLIKGTDSEVEVYGPSLPEDSELVIKDDEDFATFAFAQYTESPFYYFSLNLRDQLAMLRKATDDNTADYKDLLLSRDGGYFFMENSLDQYSSDQSTYADFKTSIGEMHDFMDMRSYFTIVLPALREANAVVKEYDKCCGLFLYDDVPISYDSDYNIEIPEQFKEGTNISYDAASSEFAKFHHNVCVSQMFNMYTPYVDLMEACKYAEPEKISVLGSDYTVKDPLDPISYVVTSEAAGDTSNGDYIIEGRPMIFSRAEMKAYNLTMSDLTSVEKNIIQMYDDIYEDLLQIMDYYTFGDDVLNTAIAMIETFNFNKHFSENNFLGESHVLFPQNYELKNFSYDAYLRLILAETTGDDITKNQTDGLSYYDYVVKNSSFVTGLVFIALDFTAVWIIPAFKLFFLMLIFLLSITIVIAAAIKLEIKLSKVLWESLMRPMFSFFLITIGLAWFVSLFMSNGNTAVTGRGGYTISLGDPVIACLVMIVANSAAIVLYFLNLKGTVRDFLKYFRAVFESVRGVLQGVAGGGWLHKLAQVATETATGRPASECVGAGTSAVSRGVANTSATGGSKASESASDNKQRHLMASGAKYAAKGIGAGAKLGAKAVKSTGKGISNVYNGRTLPQKLATNRYNKKLEKYKAGVEANDANKKLIKELNEQLANANTSAEKEHLNKRIKETQAKIDKDYAKGGIYSEKGVKKNEKMLGKSSKYINRGGKSARR